MYKNTAKGRENKNPATWWAISRGQQRLEAQVCTGGIIDPNTGECFPVTDAVNRGLVDKIMVDRINLAQKAFCGFEDPPRPRCWPP